MKYVACEVACQLIVLKLSALGEAQTLYRLIEVLAHNGVRLLLPNGDVSPFQLPAILFSARPLLTDSWKPENNGRISNAPNHALNRFVHGAAALTFFFVLVSIFITISLGEFCV